MVAFTVTMTVTGNVLTALLLRLQLAPGSEQLRVTVPLNPLRAEMLIMPLVVTLPAFTMGKVPTSAIAKSGPFTD